MASKLIIVALLITKQLQSCAPLGTYSLGYSNILRDSERGTRKFSTNGIRASLPSHLF